MKSNFLATASLAFVLALSNEAKASQDANDNNMPAAVSIVANHPIAVQEPQIVPPVITMEQYSNELILGNDLDGWGEPLGAVHSWIQVTVNKNRISNSQNQLLDDLPFFLENLCPVVDGNRLRCNYSLPVKDSDISRGEATLSVFHAATELEIQHFQAQKPETADEREARVQEWIKKLEVLRSSNIVHSLLYPPGVGGIISNANFLHTYYGDLAISSGWFTLRAEFQNRSDSANLCHFTIEGLRRKAVIVLKDIGFNIGGEIIAAHMSMLGSEEAQEASLFFCETDYTADCRVEGDKKPVFSNLIFEINGNLNFLVSRLKLQKVYCQTQGNLVFKSSDPKCFVEKIKIRPADSTQPMYVYADLELTENPMVKIECHNANLLQVKYRKVAKALESISSDKKSAE